MRCFTWRPEVGTSMSDVRLAAFRAEWEKPGWVSLSLGPRRASREKGRVACGKASERGARKTNVATQLLSTCFSSVTRGPFDLSDCVWCSDI